MTTPRLILFAVLFYIFVDLSKSDETCLGSDRYKSFNKIGNNYYLIHHSNKINWFNARDTCKRMGADLATITDDNQLTLLSKHLMSLGYGKDDWFWIAGNDLGQEGNFYWVSNGERMTFAKWSQGQPDNDHNNKVEDCVHLWFREGQFKMNDWQCKNGKAYYICQAPQPKTVCIWG
ncbi:C-type lectin 37Da-like [Teleopsis dalmanni]|uniref:C-type lectin 37Da-like n=1 Tax=Teleopsis dalmanni TaxID=139649 RepID=UPI0018CE580F|nr:C-type lectin 37Da-like [Teleopsis dalmanni]